MPIKRVNFYENQYLRATDMQVEQKYHIDMRRKHNEKLHTSGVVDGLEIAKKSDTEITISDGTAIDKTGREIELETEQTHAVSGDGEWYMTIAYKEEPTDRPEANFGLETDRIRVTESWVIKEVEGTSNLTDEQVILGVVVMENGEIKEINDGTAPNHRRMSGAAGSLTIRDAKYEDESDWVSIELEAPGKMSVDGSIKLQNGEAINEFSTDENLADMSDTAVPTEKAVKNYVDNENKRIIHGRRTAVPLLGFTIRDLDYIDARHALRNIRFELLHQPVNGITFDGTNVWITHGDGYLSKFDVNTNTSAYFQIGGELNGIVFDGTHIWVTDEQNSEVVRINLDGQDIHRVNVGIKPKRIAFDGGYIWVTNWKSNTIDKIDINTTSIDPDLTIGQIEKPLGIAFDGENIWVTERVTILSVTHYRVRKIPVNDPSNSTSITTGSIPPGDLVFDGAYIWALNSDQPGPSTICKIDVIDDVVVDTIALGLNSEGGAVFDGKNIWVANAHHELQKIDIKTHIVESVGMPPVSGSGSGGELKGLAFDGTYIWVGTAIGNLCRICV